jgi:hypothetical protein
MNLVRFVDAFTIVGSPLFSLYRADRFRRFGSKYRPTAGTMNLIEVWAGNSL